jgi:hypothetical protein
MAIQLSCENLQCSFVLNHLLKRDIFLELQANEQANKINSEVVTRKRKRTKAFKQSPSFWFCG